MLRKEVLLEFSSFCTITVVVAVTFICRLLHQRRRFLSRRRVEAVEGKENLMLI